MTVFVPVAEAFEAAARVRIIELPSAELAIAVHAGPLREADRTYGPLGTHVAERAIGVDGPIRENYLVTDDAAGDESGLRTEIGWPVFRIELAADRRHFSIEKRMPHGLLMATWPPC